MDLMPTIAQRKASAAHRKRMANQGLVRVEVKASHRDSRLIKTVADILLHDPLKAEALRTTLQTALAPQNQKSVLEIFGSELPDETFETVFDQPRPSKWREVEF
jgi:nicotinate-nucleotide pyrophosphorylase